jgi:SAM-dependent methyltransferase
MKVDYDSIAQEYAQHRRVQPEVLKNLVQTGRLTGASRVLDVGCGTGNYAIAVHDVAGCACWGVDPSEQMLLTAKARTSGIQFTQGCAERLEYPPGFFDLVFSVDVIHHVEDRPAYFQAAYPILKPGGKVCTVTDSEEIIRRRQPLSIYFPETIEAELQRYPRMSDLWAMMLAAGFVDIQETTAEFAYSLADIQSYRDKAFSSLHLIPAAAFERGIQGMEQDLRAGPIPCVSRYTLLWGTR